MTIPATARQEDRTAAAPDEELVEHVPGDFTRILERVPEARRNDESVWGSGIRS